MGFTTLAAGLAAVLSLAAASALAGQPLIVEKNHIARVALSAPAGSVIVGNPDIADVNVVDSHTVYIVGKGFGSSAVTITGRDGRPLYDAEVTVTAAQKGGITVYRGVKSSLMVCTNVCIPQDIDPASNAASTPAAPAVLMTAPLSQGAASAGNAMGGSGGATAMVVQ